MSDFSPDIREEVEGLALLGHLEEEVEYCGHRFVVRTLKAEEELIAAQIAKDYQDTLGQVKAQAWAHLALALVSVDDDEEFCEPIGPNKSDHGKARFRWITSRWYWPVGEYLWASYLRLLERQQRAISEVQDLSQGNRKTSTPSPDFSSTQGDSPPPEDIQELLDSTESSTDS